MDNCLYGFNTMKFTRRLKETQTPEWEKAYIDYRGLNVQLAAIRGKGSQDVYTLRSLERGDISYAHRFKPTDEEKCDKPREAYLSREITIPATRWRTGHKKNLSSSKLRNFPPVPPFIQNSESPTRSPLGAMLSKLPAIHSQFFDMLDAELHKVETFYTRREQEMHEHVKLLRRQLMELDKHRKLFHESFAHSKAQSWVKKAYMSISSAPLSILRRFSGQNRNLTRAHQSSENSTLVAEPCSGVNLGFIDMGALAPEYKCVGDDHSGSWRKNGATKDTIYPGTTPSRLSVDGTAWSTITHAPPNLSSGATGHLLDPREYEHAKRKLRKAVAEQYRGLEVLNNYRILNLAGFRKVLRKYGKITKISVLDAYMKEKIEPSSFASGATVGIMLKEMEHLFALRFERGNRKRAINNLRVEPISKSHHTSTLRSGMWLGLALSAIVGACYTSLQEQTRASLPSWGILLYIYSILFVPVLLALLIGTNIFVWSRYRINYTFIFKLNPRTRLDFREYFELPSFLLSALAVAFWFSLAQIGPPTLWPLAWLFLFLVVMLNPIRDFMWSHARWWTIKTMARVGASGIWTVEFADLWLGDQFCSLTYSLANLYFVGCFYAHFLVDAPNFSSQTLADSRSSLHALPLNATAPYRVESSSNDASYTFLSSAYDPQVLDAWSTCGVTQNWGWYCFLGTLPFVARLLQSLRRYWDSRCYSQLINAGKYMAGIAECIFYFYWRHHMSPRTGRSYVLFCFAATVNSLYGCAWDYFADWSMFKPYARYPLLRPELVYKSLPLYYIALLSDLFMRFTWVAFIYDNENSTEVLGFIIAIVEMLRRVQWNFYRVENKHLSNKDSYRVTRELPLPYSLDMSSCGEEEAAQLRLKKRMARLS